MTMLQKDPRGDWVILDLYEPRSKTIIASMPFIELSRYSENIPFKKLTPGRKIRGKFYLVDAIQFLEKTAAKLPKTSDYRKVIENDIQSVNWALITFGFWTPEYKVGIRREINKV